MGEAEGEPASGLARLFDVAGALVSVVSYGGLAAGFAGAWVTPARLGPSRVTDMLLLVLLEFIVIHSSAFLTVLTTQQATWGRRLLLGGGLLAFYCLFVGAFSLAFGRWWPLGSFLGLSGLKLLPYLRGQVRGAAEASALMADWAFATGCYVLTVAATAFLPVPPLGLNEAMVTSLHLPGSGLWVDQPQTALAAGFLYFAALALREAWLMVRPPRTPRLAPPPAPGQGTIIGSL